MTGITSVVLMLRLFPFKQKSVCYSCFLNCNQILNVFSLFLFSYKVTNFANKYYSGSLQHRFVLKKIFGNETATLAYCTLLVNMINLSTFSTCNKTRAGNSIFRANRLFFAQNCANERFAL